MKIAMISYHTCPLATLGGKDTGGMNVYVRDLTRQLGAMGIQVDVFTRSQDEHVPHVLHDLGFGNRVVHVPAGCEVPLPKQDLAALIPEFVKGVLEFARMKGLRYDLIHSHYWMSGLAALELRAAWQVPILHMFHTLGIMKRRVARFENEVDGDYRLNGEKKLLNQVDGIIAATLAESTQLQWLYNADMDKVKVIPPGVDLGRFYPIPPDEAKEFIGIPPCERMLLYVGRIEPLKGIDVLIEAISEMRDRGVLEEIPFCLSLIGGESDASSEVENMELIRLQELRRRYNLEGLITFLGKKSQDTLPYYYSAAEAVVVPSQYESFGMVALEAMACGTPVVASQVGGLAFLIQDGRTGYMVPSNEPTQLADRLTRLLKDQKLRQQMGKNAAELARNYSWEIIARKIVELYNQVIADQTRITNA